MCGSSAAINHSLCYTPNIWKLTLAIDILKHWSNFHTIYPKACLISLISVIHWDSNCGFLNSEIIARRISSRVLCNCPSGTTQYFMYQSNAWPHRVIIIFSFQMSSLLTRQTIHTASQRNQCSSGSFVKFLLNVGSLMSVTTIRVALGLFTGFPRFVGFARVGDGLPYAPFPTLGLLVFTCGSGEELLGLT